MLYIFFIEKDFFMKRFLIVGGSVIFGLLIVLAIELVFIYTAQYSPLISYLLAEGSILTPWQKSTFILVHDSLIVLCIFMLVLFLIKKIYKQHFGIGCAFAVQFPIAYYGFHKNILTPGFTQSIDLTPYAISNLIFTLILMIGFIGLYGFLIKHKNN
jgi:hypothetical protein